MEPGGLTQDTPQNPLLEFARAMWTRRRWLAAVTFILPLTAAVSVVMFLPGVYRSSVTVLVDRQQVPESLVQSTVTSEVESRLQTIAQEVLSRARLDAIISRFHLYEGLKGRVAPEDVIERMRSDIQIEYRGGDRERQRAMVAFAVSFKGRDPVTVAQVTNTLASYFIEENLKVRERQALGTAEFLKVQLDEAKKRLDDQEHQISEFKQRYLGGLPNQMDANVNTLERLDTELQLNVDRQTRLIERRDAYTRQLQGAGADGPVAGPDAIAEQLLKAQQELRMLRAQFSDRYPDVIRLKETIAGLERDLAQVSADKGKERKDRKERKTVTPPPTTAYGARLLQVQGDIDDDLRALKAEERRLRAAIAVYTKRVQTGPQLEQQFKELTRDYATTHELHASLAKRYDAALVAESMEQRQKGEQFRILDPAVPGSEPVAPNRLRLITMALALSAGLTVAAVFLAENVRPAFHSVDAVRAFTTVPVLLSIPEVVTAGDLVRRRRSSRLMAMSTAVSVVLIVVTAYLVAHGNEYLVTLLARGRS